MQDGETTITDRLMQLREIRKQLGCSLADLAFVTGFSIWTLHKWESGFTRPREDNLDDYEKAVKALLAARKEGKLPEKQRLPRRDWRKALAKLVGELAA